jgi:hypothetical protein
MQKKKELTACNQLKEQGINITHKGTVIMILMCFYHFLGKNLG